MAAVSNHYQTLSQQVFADKDIIDNNGLTVYTESINRFYKENNLSGIMLMVVMAE